MTAAVVYGLVAGCAYALLSFGFGLIYFTTGIFHFAHGAVYALAGYVLWWAFETHGLPFGVAAVLAVGLAAGLGWFVETVLYRPLRLRRASGDVLFLTSLGVYMVGSNALALGFGHDAHPLTSLPNPAVYVGSGSVPLVVTTVQVATIGVTIATLVALLWIFKQTPLGLAIRAYAANPELAEALALDSRRLLPLVALLGSGLGALSAVCVACDVGVTPEMGLTAVVTGAVAVVVGGVGSLPGTALGGLLLGLLQSLLRFNLAARWEEALTFGVLLLVLLFRPRGLFGRREE